MGAETQRRPGQGAAAVISLDETIAAEDSAAPANGQAKRRCPGCARKCTKLVPVRGWQDGRETLICKRCAGGLILIGDRCRGLKLRPDAPSPEARS
jgi:hypothetical protein